MYIVSIFLDYRHSKATVISKKSCEKTKTSSMTGLRPSCVNLFLNDISSDTTGYLKYNTQECSPYCSLYCQNCTNGWLCRSKVLGGEPNQGLQLCFPL